MAYEAAAAADAFITGFTLALCIRSCISCRLLHVGPLQLQRLPIPSCCTAAYEVPAVVEGVVNWLIAYAAATADAFMLAHGVLSSSC